MPIRVANLTDAPQLAKVHTLTWQTAYRGIIPNDYLQSLSIEKKTQQWEKMLREVSVSDGKSFFFVATNDQDQAVGFCNAGVQRSELKNYPSELYAIYILQEYQHQRIGHALVHTAVRRLIDAGFEAMHLWALKDNPYRQFYEKLGGSLIAEKPIKIANRDYLEVAYGWQQIKEILKR